MARPVLPRVSMRRRMLLLGFLFASSGNVAGCRSDPASDSAQTPAGDTLGVRILRLLQDRLGGSRLTLDASAATITQRGELLLHRGQPFTGEIIDRRDPRYLQKTSYEGGLRHGLAYAWYGDGSLAYERRFVAGLRQGLHVGFWPDGSPQFRYRYIDDVFVGEQQSYYRGGTPLELRTYRAGQEEGRQQIWDSQGRLSSNYIVKGGRRYGLVGSFDCVTVH